jgi:hypothetical protein
VPRHNSASAQLRVTASKFENKARELIGAEQRQLLVVLDPHITAELEKL